MIHAVRNPIPKMQPNGVQIDAVVNRNDDLGSLENNRNVKLAAFALSLLWNNDDLVGDLVTDGLVMVAEGVEFAVEVRAAHVAIELRRATFEGKRLVERLLHVVVVLSGDRPELLVLDVREECRLEVLGLGAGNIDEVLHVDFIERQLADDFVVGFLESVLIDDKVSVGIVCASVDGFVFVFLGDNHLLQKFGILDIEAKLGCLETFQLPQFLGSHSTYAEIVTTNLADIKEGFVRSIIG